MEKVNHPKHYNSHASGIECIEIAKHHDFCIGNAIKYIWRAGLKGDSDTDANIDNINQLMIQDLRKAVWYLLKEIEILESK